MNLKWEAGFKCGNLILRGDGFYVSYNTYENLCKHSLKPDISAGNGETVLVIITHNTIPAFNRFYILNGDFRAQYEDKILYGLDECLKVYINNIESKSSHSSKLKGH